MKKEDVISTLNKCKASIILSQQSIASSIDAAMSIINRIYGNDNPHYNKLNDIKSRNVMVKLMPGLNITPFGDSLQSLKKELEDTLDNLLVEISSLGLPENQKERNSNQIIVNTNLAQTQHQTQSIEVNIFLNTLKESLTDRQYNEIVEIAKKEPNAVKARGEIIEKIKSFGSDVLSNILANTITNPGIWTSFLV